MAQPQVLDTKLVKGPEKWNGDKKSWRRGEGLNAAKALTDF